MKKSSLFLAVVLIISIMTQAVQAASTVYQESETIHTESGDFEVETTTIIYRSTARSNSISADRIREVKFGGNLVAKVTLSASFGYDGKTAWTISANSSYTTYNNWSYSNENISKSKGIATLTATLTHAMHRDIPLDISITCSPTGQIS